MNDKTKFVKFNNRNFLNQLFFLFNLCNVIIFFSFILFIILLYSTSIDNSYFAQGYIKVSKNKKRVFFQDGIIDNVLIKNGDLVQKGQPIFSTDNTKLKIDLENLLHNIKYHIISDFRLLNSLKLILRYDYHCLNLNTNLFNIKYYQPKDSNIIMLSNFNKIFSYFHKYVINNYFENYLCEIKQLSLQMILAKMRILNFNKKFFIACKKYKLFIIFIYKKIFDYNSLFNIQLEMIKYNNYFIDEKIKLNFYIYKIKEAKLKKKSFFNDQHSLLFDKYKSNYMLLLNLETQFYRLKNTYYNTLILSPITGKIDNININYNLHSNIPLLEIIPQNELLFVEAFINTNEIDNVFLGGIVKIIINSERSKLSHRILGKVIYISPDDTKQFSTNHRVNNSGYYKIKIAVPNKELSQFDVNLYPGMDVTVFFIRGKSNIINFLSLPIQNIFFRSFL